MIVLIMELVRVVNVKEVVKIMVGVRLILVFYNVVRERKDVVIGYELWMVVRVLYMIFFF